MGANCSLGCLPVQLVKSTMARLVFDAACRYCSHWHSCQSVRRPGTFFMCRASTNRGFNPRRSRISKTGIQYTPVDSIATVVIPQLTSQSASLSKSAAPPHQYRKRWVPEPVSLRTTCLGACSFGLPLPSPSFIGSSQVTLNLYSFDRNQQTLPHLLLPLFAA